MTDYFVVFGDFLAALPTYLLNGVLATVYWLGESGAAFVSILCAGLIIRFVDRRVQSRAAFRPGRSGREAPTPDLYTAQITTAVILVLWVISQWGMGAPVPWLGAAMWIAGTIILLLVHMRTQRKLLDIASREGAFYTDLYALAASEQGIQAMMGLIPEAFHVSSGR